MTDQELAQLSRQLKFMARNVSNASSGLTVQEIDGPAPQFFDWKAAQNWAEQLAEVVKRTMTWDVSRRGSPIRLRYP